jgi:hypothetical protein
MPRFRNSIGALSLAVVTVATIASTAYVLADGRSGSRATESRPTNLIAAEALTTAPPSQLAALGDGVVTRLEYEQAVTRTAECAGDRGVSIEVRPGVGRQPSSLSFTAADLAAAETSRSALEDCKSLHLNAVQNVFNAQSRPDDADRAEGRRFLSGCMATHGVGDGSAPATDGQLSQWAKSTDPLVAGSVSMCAEEHFQRLGYWP